MAAQVQTRLISICYLSRPSLSRKNLLLVSPGKKAWCRKAKQNSNCASFYMEQKSAQPFFLIRVAGGEQRANCGACWLHVRDEPGGALRRRWPPPFERRRAAPTNPDVASLFSFGGRRRLPKEKRERDNDKKRTMSAKEKEKAKGKVHQIKSIHSFFLLFFHYLVQSVGNKKRRPQGVIGVGAARRRGVFRPRPVCVDEACQHE